MGFRYRKSINLGGGFRVNLSKSGIGYSWGVKGYRITKTADGRTRRTASIPGTGISYVEEHRSGSSQEPASAPQQEANPIGEYEHIKTVETAGAGDLQSAEYEDLFKRAKLFKTATVALAILTFLSLSVPPLTIVCIAALVLLFAKGRCTIEYEFDDYEREKWEKLRAAWQGVASSKSLQRIVLNAKSKNSRVTGGIENGIQTEKMMAGNKLPWYIKSDIKPITFIFKGLTLAIMPDRLLVFDMKMGAIDYKDVKFDLSAVGFLEGGPVPSDAEIVKYVWAYANNDGSPDKRYSNNKQYPVMKYGKIVVTSANGLNVQFMCSNEAAADRLNALLQKN